MKRKRWIKFSILALILIMTISLTGCGFSTGMIKEKSQDGKLVTSNGNKFNGLLIEGDATITALGNSAQYDNFLRDFAVLMYEAVFEDDYKHEDHSTCSHGNGACDYPIDYIAKEADRFAIAPKSITTNITSLTASAFTRTNDTITKIGSLDLSNILNVVKTAANAILIAVWAMGFINQIVNEKFTMETLLKTLMQLLLGVVLVNNSEKLVVAFMDIGTDLTSNISAQGASVADSFTTYKKEVLNQLDSILAIHIGFCVVGIELPIGSLIIDVFGPTTAIINMILPFIGQLLCAYKILSAMIMRMLELVIRISFAPIPLAFSAQNGFSQEAIRYFRGIMACAMQPALIIVGASCVDTIVNLIAGALSNMSSLVDQAGNAISPAATLSGLWASLSLFIAYMVLSGFIGETKRMSQEIIAR